MKPTQQELKSIIRSLMQMIEDKWQWRESLTQDDKDFLNSIHAHAIGGRNPFKWAMGENSRAIFEALKP